MHWNQQTLKLMVQKDIKIYWLLSKDDMKPIDYFLNWQKVGKNQAFILYFYMISSTG